MRLIRDRYPWKLRTQELTLGSRTLLMGVVDVSTDPAQGSQRPKVDALLDRALEMQGAGADLIDVSPQRPGGIPQRLAASEELPRLVPLLRKLRHNLDVPLSIHTFNAETAGRALELGAEIVNDWSGLSYDPQLGKVVNHYGAGLILGHVRGTPESWKKTAPVHQLMATIAKDLDSALARAAAAGIDRRRVVVDPGLEHGKRGLQNYRILVELDRLAVLRRPLLVSPSRKQFLTETVRSGETERLFATAAAATLAICGGAHILRVCEIEEIAYVAKTVDHAFEGTPSH